MSPTYGRVGKDGKKRDLHIEKALAVTNRVPIVRDKSSYPHVADCDYFTVDKLNLDGNVMKKMEGTVSGESFASILILDGSGTYQIKGSCDALITTIREKAAPVRIGIDIGGTETKIGLVDIHQKLITQTTMPTAPERPAAEIIREIGEKALALLDAQGIAMDQCVGAGNGSPKERCGAVF